MGRTRSPRLWFARGLSPFERVSICCFWWIGLDQDFVAATPEIEDAVEAYLLVPFPPNQVRISFTNKFDKWYQLSVIGACVLLSLGCSIISLTSIALTVHVVDGMMNIHTSAAVRHQQLQTALQRCLQPYTARQLRAPSYHVGEHPLIQRRKGAWPDGWLDGWLPACNGVHTHTHTHRERAREPPVVAFRMHQARQTWTTVTPFSPRPHIVCISTAHKGGSIARMTPFTLPRSRSRT